MSSRLILRIGRQQPEIDSVPCILPRRPHLAARQMSACNQQHPGCQLADTQSRVLVVLSFELDLVVDAGLSDPVL